MPKKTEILKIKDKTDSYYTKIDKLFDLPLRLLISGKSQLSGKGTTILNLFRDSFYGKYFSGSDIYYITNNKVDNKMRLLSEFKSIPEENIMPYDEEILEELYDMIEEEFIDAVSENEKPPNKMIIFDDVGYSNSLKNKEAGIISKLISNGRHLNLSQIYSIQSYKMASTTIRNQITGAILFNTSQKELELITEDMNYLENKKAFVKMFRDTIKKGGRHSFLVVNFTNDAEGFYMNNKFEPIDVKKYIE
jgi:hypothetical protein